MSVIDGATNTVTATVASATACEGWASTRPPNRLRRQRQRRHGVGDRHGAGGASGVAAVAGDGQATVSFTPPPVMGAVRSPATR